MDTNISEEQADTIFSFKVSRVRIRPSYMNRLQGRWQGKGANILYRPTGILRKKWEEWTTENGPFKDHNI